ncbi:MAG: hypothetical protein MI702_00360, partial [Chlorobiales bacterium]|nr:hypothetical protein [Chlorobiales bacterium]
MKYVTVLFMGTLLLLFSAFVSDSEEQIQIAEEIWMEIQGYTKWDIIPGGHLMMPGQAPHGKFVTIYANSAAQTALSEDKARMPDGAIYSKDNFDSNKKLNKITVMKKIDSK